MFENKTIKKIVIGAVLLALIVIIIVMTMSQETKKEYNTDMSVVVKKDKEGEIMTLIDSYVPDNTKSHLEITHRESHSDAMDAMDAMDEQIEHMQAYRQRNSQDPLAHDVRKSRESSVSHDTFLGSVTTPSTKDFYANKYDTPTGVTATAHNVERS
jgi:uncharacterized protein involved in exopolysaccharide biosynthesis